MNCMISDRLEMELKDLPPSAQVKTEWQNGIGIVEIQLEEPCPGFSAEWRIPQDDKDSSYAGMLTRELGEIDWTKSAIAIERLIRGLNSWPSAYTHMNGKTLKIWDADVTPDTAAGEDAAGLPVPGTVTRVTKDSIYVQTGDGQLKLNEVQLQGKKRMPVQAFLLGNKVEKGMVYGRQD